MQKLIKSTMLIIIMANKDESEPKISGKNQKYSQSDFIQYIFDIRYSYLLRSALLRFSKTSLEYMNDSFVLDVKFYSIYANKNAKIFELIYSWSFQLEQNFHDIRFRHQIFKGAFSLWKSSCD